MNTPNKLTIARIIMIPFFVAFLMYDITGSADTVSYTHLTLPTN